MRLALGTVQFGLDYGISNAAGRTPIDECERVCRLAISAGINCFDTAQAYGASEQILGQVLPVEPTLKIVTKVPARMPASDIEKAFSRSLALLRRKSVYGLLLHSADDLVGPESGEIVNVLERLKSRGLVEKVGVSFYEPEQVEPALRIFRIDLAQIPISILDQRFLRSGMTARLKAEGVELHSRSAFLQGLLLMKRENISPYFASIFPILDDLRLSVGREPGSMMRAAIGFCRKVDDLDQVIVGVNTAAQLAEILKAFDRPIDMDFSRFAIDNPKFVNPSMWKV